MTAKSAIGSIAWIAAEQENVHTLLQQEKEEMMFPAQHEVEWLNEHMADIFSRNHVDVANVFKTPGKLKGKTPRTVRHRAGDERIPLSDVFSSQPVQKSSPVKAKRMLHFQVAHQVESQQPSKSQADSGYHGSSQVEEPGQKTPELPSRSPLRLLNPGIEDTREHEDEIHTAEGSFHSAKENQTLKLNKEVLEGSLVHATRRAEIVGIQDTDRAMPQFDDIGSPSDESTPDRPPIRKKSSMNFASLPAREPLKTSLGPQVSRKSHASLKAEAGVAQFRSMASDSQAEDEEMTDDESNIQILAVDDSEPDLQAGRHLSKASTQRLHDRIDALGKPALLKTSKAISSASAIADIRKSNDEAQRKFAGVGKDDDDDWIEPLKESRPPVPNVDDESEDEFDVRAPELIAHEERMTQLSPSPMRLGFTHAKSASTATLQSPAKVTMGPPLSPAKSISVSNPAHISSTPQASPNRFIDGPLSASKSKLASIMKTAKGLFTSSASVSAAAKMEALPTNDIDSIPSMYPNLAVLNKPLPASPSKGGRRTRSSTEREKEERKKQKDNETRQKVEDQLEQAREREKQKASQQKCVSPRKEDNRQVSATAAKTVRPFRPTRDVSKTRPQPVSIKVGTVSHRVNPAQETLQAEPKRPGLTKNTSTTSLQSSTSTAALKTSFVAPHGKPRALIAAERKREQDEREALKKLEQRKELERKRAAQQEEARQQEQEQRAEAERVERERLASERAKRQAQQQAIERKRQEALKKAEQQRLDRIDASSARPPSRLGQQPLTRPLVNQQLPTNPAKPAKRPIEEEVSRQQAPRFGVVPQHNDAKRRRTDDEPVEQPVRPTMSGAPIRQSYLGKKPSIFNHPSYQQASNQPHVSQFPHPPRVVPQMSQFANSKIPFAEPGVAGPAKTPASTYQHRTIQAVKSSPHYQNGESIHLPEIPTDSEDEDSEDEGNAFPIPDWATPGHLTEQLIRQEGMDGDAVFGPIAPLKMEEIFAKGNKDRLKRLRDRTSSANWALSGDGLTLEEVKADREQRERMRLQGGWQYGS